MKIKFNSVDEILLNKAIDILIMIIVVRAIFNKKKKTNIIHKFFSMNVCIKYKNGE